MAKIGLIGDLHFRGKHLQDITTAWEKTLNICNDKKVQYILQTGDVFNNYNVAERNAPFGTIFSAFISPLMKWLGEENRKEVVAIRPNVF